MEDYITYCWASQNLVREGVYEVSRTDHSAVLSDDIDYIHQGHVWRDGDADSGGGESCLFLCWWEGYPGPEWTALCQVR